MFEKFHPLCLDDMIVINNLLYFLGKGGGGGGGLLILKNEIEKFFEGGIFQKQANNSAR